MNATTDQLDSRFREVTPHGWEASSLGYIQKELFVKHLQAGNVVVVVCPKDGYPQLVTHPATKRFKS